MTKERSIPNLLFSLSIMCGAAAVFGLAFDFLPTPWDAGAAFSAAFMGGRWAYSVYPV